MSHLIIDPNNVGHLYNHSTTGGQEVPRASETLQSQGTHHILLGRHHILTRGEAKSDIDSREAQERRGRGHGRSRP